MISDEEAQAKFVAATARVYEVHELWSTCDHEGAASRGHRCPKCRGTLRRCCDTLIARQAHADTCPEIAGLAAQG